MVFIYVCRDLLNGAKSNRFLCNKYKLGEILNFLSNNNEDRRNSNWLSKHIQYYWAYLCSLLCIKLITEQINNKNSRL